MTALYWILGALAVGIIAVSGWAMTLPKEASASRSALINAPVSDVFALVTNPAAQSAWRSDIGSVTVAKDGKTWVETTAQGFEIHFTEETKAPGLYVISYISPQGFTGHWDGRFQDESGATRVDIVETTRIEGMVARAMARIFAPAGAHIDLYLKDLENTFSEAN